MDTTINERVRQIIDAHCAGSVDEFARACSWSTPYVYMILNEKRPISLTCVQTILQSFRDVDARWLATGDGSMSRSFEQTLLRKLDLLRQAMRYRSVMTTQQRDVFDSLAGNEELEGFINANIDVWIRRYVAPHGGVSFLDK